MRLLESGEDFNEAHQLIMKSTIAHPMWKVMPPDRQEDSALQGYLLRESFNHKMAFGYDHNGKLIALQTYLPVRDYLKSTPPKCPNSKLFSIMAPYEKKMDDAMLNYITEHGEMEKAIFSYWSIVDPEFQNKKVISYIGSYNLQLLFKRGWHFMYSVLTHPKSLQISLKGLTTVLVEDVFQEDLFKGHKIQLVRTDMEGSLRKFKDTGFPARPKL